MREDETIMDQEPTSRERLEDLLRLLLVPDWRPTIGQGLWMIRIAIVLSILILVGYGYGITLWDWLRLLIVPAAIAGVGLWFNQQQREREIRIADQRAQTDREIADQGRLNDILQAYIDQMGQLLLDKDRPLRQSEWGDEIVTLARARTLTALSQLDGGRKSAVMRFLLEAGLITVYSDSPEERQHPTIRLMEADLQEVDMTTYEWSGIDMTAAWLNGADLSVCGLSNAILSGAELSNSYLSDTDLRGADLNAARLKNAVLNGADLTDASLFLADLTNANLSAADLTGADLTGEDHRTSEDSFLGANLTNADLSDANLTNAKVTTEQLARAKTLKGATMPNGSKHP
jgi:uncharacterized protein YjbI with pentapeptide repeats